MTDTDFVPPPLPGEKTPEQRQRGFFKKFFLKEEKTPVVRTAESSAVTKPGPDELSRIREKLGLNNHDDDPTFSFQTPPQSGESKPEETEIPDPEDFLREIAPEPVATEYEQHAPQPVAEQHLEELPETKAKKISASAPIDDWTAEATIESHEESPQSPWIAGVEHTGEPLAHHDIVEKHLKPIAEAHAKLDAVLEKHATPLDVPEWAVQKKEIPPRQYFILRNGQPIKSLHDLMEAITYIDDATFNHHVGEYRNDFANWVGDIIGNTELAQEIRSAKDREGIIDALHAHREEVAKAYQNSHNDLEQTIEQRKKALVKLSDVEKKFQTLRKQLEQKSKTLASQKALRSKLVKGALDQEVAKRIQKERDALENERREFSRKQKDVEKSLKEREARLHDLDAREEKIGQRENAIEEIEARLQARQEQLNKDLESARPLLEQAEDLRKRFEAGKTAQKQTEKNLKAISEKEIAISRHEETMRQREKKITVDLTRLHEQEERLKGLKEEYAKREAEAKRLEIEATKRTSESEARMKAALEAEKSSIARIREETKKLESVRKQIDRALAKTLKSKNKITTAVALRKHLEEQLLATRKEIVQERETLRDETERAVSATVASMPIGQPASHDEHDPFNVKNADMLRRIEDAKAALQRKDLESARQAYNVLREEFSQLPQAHPERNVLYASIRELYDDIHLAMLEE